MIWIHDHLSQWHPYRLAYGKCWARHANAGWHTISPHLYAHYLNATANPPAILAIEDNRDPWQRAAVILSTVLIGMCAVLVVVGT